MLKCHFIKKGFTLIELLIVVGIIAILAGIVIIAVNPTKQFAQANNTERQIEIKKIMDSITQYSIDRRGDMTSLLPLGYVKGTTGSIVTGTSVGSTEINLSLLAPTYITPELPIDPSLPSSSHDTGYKFLLDNMGMLKISAPMAELGAKIFLVTRAS